jgi:hypothetical protein
VSRPLAIVILGVLLAFAACGGDDEAGAPSTTAPTPTTAAIATDGTGAVVSAHQCVPSGAQRGDATVAWERLRNPVFATDHMTKDQTIRLIDGRWHLFFSEMVDEEKRTGHVTSTDMVRWTPAPPADRFGSPDITRARDGKYVITLQLPDPKNPDLRKIYYRTASNPEGPWSEPAQLVPALFEDERIIDSAIAHTASGLFLLFKRGLHDSVVQHDELAYSPSGSLDGPWQHLGQPDLPWSENFELLPIDGVWHVLVTTIPIHHPALFRLAGPPADPQSWLHWTQVSQFDIPQEDWNRGETPGITHETANSAYLCDARELDGYWYLLYAGSTELTTFDGRGHAKIGLARSRDLVRWDVPPGAEA